MTLKGTTRLGHGPGVNGKAGVRTQVCETRFQSLPGTAHNRREQRGDPEKMEPPSSSGDVSGGTMSLLLFNNPND